MRDLSFKEFLSKYQKVPFEEYPNRVLEAMPTPKVSVVISTYNHAGFIRECLDGVLMQETDFPFEILIGEDESNDGTREICIEYARHFPEKIRLFLHRRENNILIDGQPTGNFQVTTSILGGRAPYIAFCEGDDYWTDPQKLKKQHDLLEQNPKFVMSSHQATIVDEKGRRKSDGKLPEALRKTRSGYDLRCGAWVLTLTSFYRNIFETIPEEFLGVINGDTFLFSVLGKKGGSYFHDDISNAVYRQHSGGIWSSKSLQAQLMFQLKTYSAMIGYHTRTGSDLQTIRSLQNRWVNLQHRRVFSISIRENPIAFIENLVRTLIFSVRNDQHRLIPLILVRTASTLMSKFVRNIWKTKKVTLAL